MVAMPDVGVEDPIITVKVRKSLAQRIQLVKEQHGFASANVLIGKALDAFEKANGGSGRRGMH